MATVNKSLGLALTSTLQDVYVVPTAKAAVMWHMTVNYTGTAATAKLTVNAVLGGTARALIDDVTIGKRLPYTFSIRAALLVGEKIEASCTETGATLVISIYEEDAA